MTAPEGLDLVDYKFTKLPLVKICVDEGLGIRGILLEDHVTWCTLRISIPLILHPHTGKVSRVFYRCCV